jgi:hypothetical protein
MRLPQFRLGEGMIMGWPRMAQFVQVAAMRVQRGPRWMTTLPPAQWPAPIVHMPSARFRLEEAIAAADNPDPATHLEQKWKSTLHG